MDDSIFTLQNRETGEYRTFKIETQDLDAKFAPGKQVVSLLSGPANRHDYKPFGFVLDLFPDGTNVLVWKSCRAELPGKKSEYEKMAILLMQFWNTLEYQIRYRQIDAVPCSRCGELLTVPESIDRGMGPYCAKQM